MIFLGSQSDNPELQKTSEKLLKKERALYSKYKNMLDTPTVLELDRTRVKISFSKFYQKFHDLSAARTPKQALDKILKIFQNDAKGSILYYSGMSQNNGNWLLNSEDRASVISYNDILKVWKRKAKCQKHLLIIIDSDYSGHWCRQLMIRPTTTMSIQTSSSYWQECVADVKVGSYFTHNLLKIMNKKNEENIVEPLLNKQIPRFTGNFSRCEKIFGLRLKFESWMDMRKALGISKYGTWPRQGDNGYFSRNENGTYYEGDFDNGNKKEGMGTLFAP